MSHVGLGCQVLQSLHQPCLQGLPEGTSEGAAVGWHTVGAPETVRHPGFRESYITYVACSYCLVLSVMKRLLSAGVCVEEGEMNGTQPMPCRSSAQEKPVPQRTVI